jgi:hypothetical protein
VTAFIAGLWDRLISAFCWWLCAALPHRARVIPHAEDPTRPLLQQFLIYHRAATDSKPSLSVYLQHFITPESQQFAHRHRWQKMRSFVLSGYFMEHRYKLNGTVWIKLHSRLSTYTMNHETIYNVCYWSRHCWTIFVAVNAGDDWGYYCTSEWGNSWANPSSRFIPWRQHIKQRVAALETGEVTK